jgi:hypothetical protein
MQRDLRPPPVATRENGTTASGDRTMMDDTVDPGYGRQTCNITKVLALVRKKIVNTRRAYQFMRYIVFSVLFWVVVLLQRDPEASCSMQSALRKYFLRGYRDPHTLSNKNFLSIRTVDEFWDWHIISFCPGSVFVQSLPNGAPMAVEPNTMLVHNRLTRGFRMMQRRGKPSECPLGKKWAVFAPICTGRTFLEGLLGPVDKEQFQGAMPVNNVPVTYAYTEMDVGAGIKEGGYFQTFAADHSECAKMGELKRQRWIDRHTQFYRLDLVVYNPNVGLFANVNFKVTFDNSGNLHPEYYSETISATMYTSWTDMVRLGLEIVYVIFWLCLVVSNTRRAFLTAMDTRRTFAYFDEGLCTMLAVQLALNLAIIITWILIAVNETR